MKKFFTYLIVGVLVLSGIGIVSGTEDNEKFMSESINLSQPSIIDDQDYASIQLNEATYNSWEENMPSLPVVTKVYTFPFGTCINSVNVEFSDTIRKTLTKPVNPAPEVIIDSMVSKTKESKTPSPIISYSDIDVYPEQQFSYKTAAGLKEKEHVIYLSVHLYPIQYYPNEKAIYASGQATIDITYTLPEKPIVFGDDYDLIVIAPTEFSDEFSTEYAIPNSDKVVSFVDYKNNHGFSTKVVTLDEIYDSTYFPAEGLDDQEKIKYFIKNSIESWGITYVLLVGSWVELEDEPPDSKYANFPMRKAYIGSSNYEEWFPSDLYFADIYNNKTEFSDWDFDDDGKYAEYSRDLPDVDVLPDVYISRFACINEGQLEDVIKKTLYYEIHNKMTNKIVQVGGDSFTDDSTNEGEYANTQVYELFPNDYTSTQLWASTQTLTKKNVADGFKSNIDFFDLCGHGSWASFATHPPGDDETWLPDKTLISPYTGFLYVDFDLYTINNAMKYPVCVYKSCSNSKFSESETCFGWKTVSKANGGGIASYAASGISYGATGTDIVERTTGWMEVKSFEELLGTKILGQVWGNSITDYYNTFAIELDDADWKTLLEWTMFGDPTLSADDGEEPKISSVNRPLFTNYMQAILTKVPILTQILYKIINK